MSRSRLTPARALLLWLFVLILANTALIALILHVRDSRDPEPLIGSPAFARLPTTPNSPRESWIQVTPDDFASRRYEHSFICNYWISEQRSGFWAPTRAARVLTLDATAPRRKPPLEDLDAARRACADWLRKQGHIDARDADRLAAKGTIDETVPRFSGHLVNAATIAAALISLLALARGTPIAFRLLQHVRTGSCPACGYNLSATPKTHPCPECGHSLT